MSKQQAKEIILNKSATAVAEALAYALKFDCDDLNARNNIVSDFWNSLNRKGVIYAEEVDPAIKITHEKMEMK